jgi:hypothetical protein
LAAGAVICADERQFRHAPQFFDGHRHEIRP